VKTKYLAVLLVIPLLFSVALASSNTLVENDFEEVSWTVKDGYAVFDDNQVQLLASASSKMSHIKYDTTLYELNNNTYPNKLYVRVSYQNGSFIENLNDYASLQILFTNTSSKDICISIGEDPNHNLNALFKVLTVEGSKNTTLSTKYAPKDFIVMFDGYWAILYNTDGDVLASLELDQGLTHDLNVFAFKTYGYESLTIDDYKVSLTLEDAKHSNIDTTVNAWIPILLTMAMLSACFGMLKKFT